MHKTVQDVSHCNSLRINKSTDVNGNSNSSETFYSVNQEVESEIVNIDRINTSFKDLKITSFAEESVNTAEIVHPAGTIINIIPGMNTAIVQPLSPNDLLYLKTPLYLDYAVVQSYNCMNLLGYIDDIFGCIKDPLYSVKLCPASQNALKIGEKIYYSLNNPTTRFMYVKHMEECNIIKHKVITRTT